jgi:hypothetical protein
MGHGRLNKAIFYGGVEQPEICCVTYETLIWRHSGNDMREVCLAFLVLVLVGCVECHYVGRKYQEWECLEIDLSNGCYDKYMVETYVANGVYEYRGNWVRQ